MEAREGYTVKNTKDAFDRFLEAGMEFVSRRHLEPKKVRIPVSDAGRILSCKHAGIPKNLAKKIAAIELYGLVGLAVEIDHAPDARFCFE